MKRIVPDTSVLIEGILSKRIVENDLNNLEIIIPRVVLDELQAQASLGRDIGFKGLDEIIRLRHLSEERNIVLKYVGERPSIEAIRLARKGRLDALIRDVASEFNAVLYTMDYVQSLVAVAEGIAVEFIGPERPAMRIK